MRHVPQRLPCHGFTMRHDPIECCQQLKDSIAVCSLAHPSIGDSHGSDASVQVSNRHERQAHIRLDDVDDCLIDFSSREEP